MASNQKAKYIKLLAVPSGNSSAHPSPRQGPKVSPRQLSHGLSGRRSRQSSLNASVGRPHPDVDAPARTQQLPKARLTVDAAQAKKDAGYTASTDFYTKKRQVR